MGQGYGNVTDSGFVGFDKDLDEGAWGKIVTKKWEAEATESAASLLDAPLQVAYKLQLRGSIGRLLAALGTPSLTALDGAWDSAQRRLFHRIGGARDDEDRSVREAGDRLAAGLLAGTGTQQTQYDLDTEVDFGRKQVALTEGNGPLAADAKKAKLESALADVKKTTEALAEGLGRRTGDKRKPRSMQVRQALASCVAAFNAVHGGLELGLEGTPKGPGRDMLTALLEPLDALLGRHAPSPAAADAPAAPTPAPEDKPA
jgi:hypothetical protein